MQSICVCVSVSILNAKCLYTFILSGVMITERGKKRGTHFTQDIMFSLCKYRSYIYTEVNYDIMFPLYGIVFTHYMNIFCSITT